MKTILIYSPNTIAPNNVLQKLQKRLIDTLRFQGTSFEKSRKESIIVGDTKILFYDAGKRNDRAFTRRHKEVDVVFYTHHVHFKNDTTPFCLVEHQFLSEKTPILSPNHDFAFLQLANHILEIRTKPMYRFDPTNGTATLVHVPVGTHLLFYIPASEKEEVRKLLESCYTREVNKTESLQEDLREQDVKMKRILDSIAKL